MGTEYICHSNTVDVVMHQTKFSRNGVIAWQYSYICTNLSFTDLPFQTQPNSLKNKILDPFPTQLVGQPNPWSSLAPVNPHWFYLPDLPFWHWLTRVVTDTVQGGRKMVVVVVVVVGSLLPVNVWGQGHTARSYTRVTVKGEIGP